MKVYGQISVVLLAALQSLVSPAVAQNPGIGGIAQAFGTDLNQDGAHPWYRVEVLAFAYNGFDPAEEIFPDEPFEIRLDTRPPKHLIAPAPRDPEFLAPPGLEETDQLAAMDESNGSVTSAATTDAPGPESLLAITPDEGPPTTEQVGDSENRTPGNGELEPADPQEAGLISDLDGVSESEPVPILGPLGPADDGTLSALLYESMTAGADALPGDDRYPIRTAYVQRLIASLQTLEDQSNVPLVFDPIPESLPLPGPDATDLEPLGSDAADSGAIDADEPDPANPAPRQTFRNLRADELELRGALLRLQRDGDYTPLAHGGWIQPAYPPEQAIPVDISLLGTVNPVGTVQLHLSRFLHVTVDLLYRAPPVPPPLQAAQAVDGVLSELNLPLRYALRIQRRVRSGDIHYLDHPAIGLLVVVRPQPVEAQDTDDPLSPPRGPAA